MTSPIAPFSSPPLPGDIGLTSIRGPVGRLVRAGQWLNGDGFGAWEHAFLVLPGERLIEAMPGGARIVPLDTYDRRDVLFMAPNGLTRQQRLDICEAGAAYEGVPYSFLDYVALATHRLRLPAPGLHAYVASTRHMICSQLVDQAYRDAGVHLFDDDRWSGYVTPGALHRRLAAISTLSAAERWIATPAEAFLRFPAEDGEAPQVRRLHPNEPVASAGTDEGPRGVPGPRQGR
ncbi:hypothetical protein [Kitasatospora cineracea]|uniref:Permuted papain-like amidase YaeF/Yiix C92 family enzyme n=1 Tax=Kitasatospora cineracea TaxID=88074 RepID=A0A3N4RJZ9_9ACTN|nr:hypothetical protein EDD38_7372 [Kitasatospora cineracea]RPE27360.1 hypothetical protein EDD38_7505 [Kitasatospora cineracea]